MQSDTNPDTSVSSQCHPQQSLFKVLIKPCKAGWCNYSCYRVACM